MNKKGYKKISGSNNISLNESMGGICEDYKIYGNSEKSVISESYTQLEYIESTGTQYIDTGVKLKGLTSKFIIDLSINREVDSHIPIGCHENDTLTHFSFNYYDTGNRVYRYYDNTGYLYTEASESFSGNRHILEMNPTNVLINGNNVFSYNSVDFTTIGNCYIFAANYKNLTTAYYTKTKIYSAKIYENDILIRNFIPVRKDNTGELGLFDRVNKIFYTNKGTGIFNYSELEYERKFYSSKNNIYGLGERRNLLDFDTYIKPYATLQEDGSWYVNFSPLHQLYGHTPGLDIGIDGNKQYTISWWGKNLSTTSNGGCIGFFYSDGTYAYQRIPPNTMELTYFSITSNALKQIVGIEITYGNASTSYIKDLQIYLTENSSINILNTGVNLCKDLSQWNLVNGAYIEDGWIVLPNENSRANIYIDWKKRGRYFYLTAKTDSQSTNYMIHVNTSYIDSNGSLISGNGNATTVNNGNYSFVVNYEPYNTYISQSDKIILQFARSVAYATQEYKFKNVMFSDNNTEYEPYTNSITNIDLYNQNIEPLYRLPNGVCDYIDYKNNKIVRNITKVTITENMVSHYSNNRRAIPSIFIPKGGIVGWQSSWKTQVAMFENYREITAVSQVASGVFTTNFVIGYIEIMDSRFMNLEEAKKLLVGTSFIIQKSIPIEENIILPQIPLLDNITTININDGYLQASEIDIDLWSGNDKVTTITTLDNNLFYSDDKIFSVKG